MAEGIMKELLKDQDVRIISAGTSVLMSGPANNKAIEVMREMGIDITTHKSQAVTVDMIKEADVILTMTENHKEDILDLHPAAKEKVFTLKEFASREYDIGSQKILDLEDKIDDKKNIYLDSHLDEIHGLMTRKKLLENEIQEIDNLLEEHKSKIKEFVRRDYEKLSQLEDISLDIPDPYGKDLAEYRSTANIIKEYIEEIAKKLR